MTTRLADAAPLLLLTLAIALVPCSPTSAQDPATPPDANAEPTPSEGMLPVPEYSGDVLARPRLTGDWGGVRRDWAEHGITIDLDWYQAYQSVVDGGRREGAQYATNLDYRVTLDLMRMGALPGALVSIRAQSRFGDTVNGASGLLLPVNTYSAFPLGSVPDGDVGFTMTELNWLQFVTPELGFLAGKITTMGTANEFMGGAGRSQFMNFQFIFPSALAQLAPYSTLAVGALWLPSPDWTVSSILMNLSDSSTTTGIEDIGEGSTWATTIDYLGSLNSLPGGGSVGFYYGFDANFARIGGLNFDPTAGASIDHKSEAWALSWSGWQYFTTEEEPAAVDPRDGRQDLEGLGVFAQVGIADEDTNPTSWSITGGLSGRGSIPGRDADTWGLGGFYNHLQNLELGAIDLASSTSGVEAYYDIAMTGSISLTLDAQWTRSALPDIDDATILGARLNVRF